MLSYIKGNDRLNIFENRILRQKMRLKNDDKGNGESPTLKIFVVFTIHLI